MNHYRCMVLTGCLKGGVFALLGLAVTPGHGATVWTGPNINFSKSAATPSDVIVAGKVVLTRGGNQVLYNTAAGEQSAGTSSPADTEWAFGNLSNFSSLSYASLESLRNGDLAGRIVNQPMVVHLINEDIYFSIKITTWGQFGAGTVAYTRSIAPAPVAPTATVTSPANGAVFIAPANVTIEANATVSGGTVTNVSFFNQTTLLGAVTSPPFNLALSNLAAGAYSLSAVATASGISTTSSVVNITVMSPAPVSISAPGISNGLFSFSYTADVGQSYLVQSSANLIDWTLVATNSAASNPALFSADIGTNSNLYYRISRLPSP